MFSVYAECAKYAVFLDFSFHIIFFNGSYFGFVIRWQFNKMTHAFDTLLRCIYVALNRQVLSFQSKRFGRQANREYLSSAMIYSTFTEWQRVTFVRPTRVRCMRVQTRDGDHHEPWHSLHDWLYKHDVYNTKFTIYSYNMLYISLKISSLLFFTSVNFSDISFRFVLNSV